MRRPWQVWTLFLLGVALVATPMVWLTLKALELDRKELAARQQIEIELRDRHLHVEPLGERAFGMRFQPRRTEHGETGPEHDGE